MHERFGPAVFILPLLLLVFGIFNGGVTVTQSVCQLGHLQRKLMRRWVMREIPIQYLMCVSKLYIYKKGRYFHRVNNYGGRTFAE